MLAKPQFRARKGDRVVVEGRKVGIGSRAGTILEVLGEPGSERYRVRWDDGHESVYTLSSDTRIEPKPKPKTTRAKA
jgi:Domain of unknown function (DUF1918)